MNWGSSFRQAKHNPAYVCRLADFTEPLERLQWFRQVLGVMPRGSKEWTAHPLFLLVVLQIVQQWSHLSLRLLDRPRDACGAFECFLLNAAAFLIQDGTYMKATSVHMECSIILITIRESRITIREAGYRSKATGHH